MVKSNRSIVAKVSTSDIEGVGKGGRMYPEEANQFIDYMVDNVAFLKDIRNIKMTRPEYDLDYIGISARQIRKGVEGVAPTGLANINTSKKQLKTEESIMAFDTTRNVLEDNIERAKLAQTTVRLMAGQFANDVCDLAINGDTADTTSADKLFLNIADGFIKQAKAAGAATHKVDTEASTDYKAVVFKKILAALPNQFKQNKADLRFYVSPSVQEEYIDQLTTRTTAFGDKILTTGDTQPYKGILVFPVPYIPDGVIILTNRMNLAWGVQRDFMVDKEDVPRKRTTEYTLTSRFDPAKIVWDDALVIGYDINGDEDAGKGSAIKFIGAGTFSGGGVKVKTGDVVDVSDKKYLSKLLASGLFKKA